MKKQFIRYGLLTALLLVFSQLSWGQQFTKFMRDGKEFNLDGYKDTLKEGQVRTIQLYAEGSGTATPYIIAKNLADGWMYFVAPNNAGSATLRLLPLDDGEGDYTLTFEVVDRDKTPVQKSTVSMLLHVIDRNAYDGNDLTIVNYPNPVTTETTFEFTVPHDGVCSLKLYMLDGREVMTVYDANAIRYRYFKTVDVSSLRSGTYVYHLKLNGTDISGRLIKL